MTACELVRKGVKLQSSYDEQLLDEVAWRVAREREFQTVEQKEQQRVQLENIKKTIEAIETSKVRCTCHDFFHWRDLWRADPQITCDLRDSGHHLPHCTLARVIGPCQDQIPPTVAPESDKLKVLVRSSPRSEAMLVISCVDHSDAWFYAMDSLPDRDESGFYMTASGGKVVTEILAEPWALNPGYHDCTDQTSAETAEMTQSESEAQSERGASETSMHVVINNLRPKKWFVGHGVFSECQRCKSTIEVGIMYYGCHLERHGWDAACQELSFHHFAGKCEATNSHTETVEDAFPEYISRSWAEHAGKPLQGVPGSDQGVTELAYRAMMEHCGLRAAFMIDYLKITETGRLYQGGRLNNPAHIGDLAKRAVRQRENPNLQEYWEEVRRKRVQLTSLYNKIRDCDSEPGGESEDAGDDFTMRPKVPGCPHVHFTAPTFGVFRLRDAPFRLDPEWQLDDTDVVHAWQTLDVAKVRGLGTQFVAEATELITSLGQWPRFSMNASTRAGRTESRLANVVQAWCALHASRSEVLVLTRLQSLQRSEATELAPTTWCDQAELMLRRFGLHVGEFCNTSKNQRIYT